MSSVMVGLENCGEKTSDVSMSVSGANAAVRAHEILLRFCNFSLLLRRQRGRMRRGNFKDLCCSSRVKKERGCEGPEFRFGAIKITSWEGLSLTAGGMQAAKWSL